MIKNYSWQDSFVSQYFFIIPNQKLTPIQSKKKCNGLVMQNWASLFMKVFIIIQLINSRFVTCLKV